MIADGVAVLSTHLLQKPWHLANKKTVQTLVFRH